MKYLRQRRIDRRTDHRRCQPSGRFVWLTEEGQTRSFLVREIRGNAGYGPGYPGLPADRSGFPRTGGAIQPQHGTDGRDAAVRAVYNDGLCLYASDAPSRLSVVGVKTATPAKLDGQPMLCVRYTSQQWDEVCDISGLQRHPGHHAGSGQRYHPLHSCRSTSLLTLAVKARVDR